MELSVLQRVWGNSEGYVFVPKIRGWKPNEHDPSKVKSITYDEGRPASIPTVLAQLNAIISNGLGDGIDFYWCPTRFTNATKRHKDNVVEQLNILWADLDEVDPSTLAIRPTIAWKSSESHYQCIWILDSYLPKDDIEELNRQMTYATGADKSGWDLTQILRIPGSKNYKYDKAGQVCELLWSDTEVCKLSDVQWFLGKTTNTTTNSVSVDDLTKGWNIPRKAWEILHAPTAEVGKRSEVLWELECLLAEADIPVAQIVKIVKASVWNKFKGRRDEEAQILGEVVKAQDKIKMDKQQKTTKPTQGADNLINARQRNFDTLDNFIYKDIESPQYMVEGFWQEASVGIVAGEPKTMKSTMIMDMGISVASGKPFLGIYHVNQHPTLYIQEENNEADMKSRVIKISKHKRCVTYGNMGFNTGAIPFYIMNNQGFNLTKPEDQEYIEQFIQDKQIKFIILDPLYMMLGGINENDASEIRPVLQFLTSLRNKYNCAVCVVHHFKKGESDRQGQRMRGSSIFHAWIECALYAELKGNNPGEVVLGREFRSFPSMKGLCLKFMTEDTSKYEVKVELSTDLASENTRHKITKASEITAEELELSGSFGDTSDGVGKVFSDIALLMDVKEGRKTIEDIAEEYGINRGVVNKKLRDMVLNGLLKTSVTSPKKLSDYTLVLGDDVNDV